jgi:hypothetical protein
METNSNLLLLYNPVFFFLQDLFSVQHLLYSLFLAGIHFSPDDGDNYSFEVSFDSNLTTLHISQKTGLSVKYGW